MQSQQNSLEMQKCTNLCMCVYRMHAIKAIIVYHLSVFTGDNKL